jgi:hypothetical protein
MAKAHIDRAIEQLQKNRINTTLATESYHLKLTDITSARIYDVI